jgi:ABC-type Fe3+/spermidine/putrescine transport system ATPase subunit
MGGSNFLKGKLLSRDMVDNQYLPVELFNGGQVLCLCEKAPDTDQVFLFIRPEFISISATEPKKEDRRLNSLKVKVNQKAYLGSQEEFSLDVGGEKLQAITRPKENIRRGGEAWVIFHADDSLLLTE